MKALEELMFSISLLDGVSAPLRKIDRQIGALKDDALKSFKQIGAGAAGMFASAYALNKSIDPARNVKRSLGELASLDVSNDSLDQMLNKGLEYSVQFGANAKDFISSAYDIQSSIDSLSGTQLSNLTATSNTLAKATKSDAAIITDYMGTMYGIFKDSAKEMGVDVWADSLAGMTATSVKMFKTEGTKVSAFFGNLGADATKLGMTLKEQLAVGGMLGATLSGSESATKLKSFLSGIGKAQKELGLNFTDDTGRMLPIVEILDKIKGKFGDLSKVEDSDLIKKAFGTKEAASFIKLIGQDTDTLNNSIDQIGRTDGLQKVTDMAMKMVDPIDRTTSGMTALRIAFGKPLSDWMDPYFNKLADGMQQILKWSGEYKHLTKAISLTGGAVIGLFGVLSTLALITGLTRLAMVGLRSGLLVLYPVMWLINGGMLVMRGLMATMAFIKMAGGVLTLTKMMGGLRAIIFAVNIAMWANPAVLLIGAIVGLVAGVGLLIYYWDDLRASFADNAVIMALMDVVELLISPFELVWKGIRALIDIWDETKGSLGDSIWADLLIGMVDSVLHPIDHFKEVINGLQRVWQALTEYFSSDAWSTKLKSIIESVTSFLDPLIKKWESFTNAASAVKNVVSATVDAGAMKVSGFVDSVKEKVGLKEPAMPLVSGNDAINLGNSVSIDQMVKSVQPATNNVTKITNNETLKSIESTKVTNEKVTKIIESTKAPVNKVVVPFKPVNLNAGTSPSVNKMIESVKAPIPNNVTNINNHKSISNSTEINKAVPNVIKLPEAVKTPIPNNLVSISDNTKKTEPKKLHIDGLKVKSKVPQGGLKQTINKSQTNNTNNNSQSGMQIGEVKIYPQTEMDPHSFKRMLEVAV